MGNVVNLIDARKEKEETELAMDFAQLLTEYVIPQLSAVELNEFTEAHGKRDMKRVLSIASPYIHRYRMELMNGGYSE